MVVVTTQHIGGIKMKRFVIGCSLFVLLGIVACGTESPSEDEETVGEPVEETEPKVEKEQGDPGASGSSDAAEIKEIPVYVEGETEMRPAQFHRSGLGYAIYVLENFTLESEEPNRDVILSQYDNSFFTRVTVHGTDAKANELKQTIIDHADGEVSEDIDVPLEGVSYALREEITTNGEKTTIIHVAKEYNGELIGYTLFLPLKEAVEGMEPSMWAMLETVSY